MQKNVYFSTKRYFNSESHLKNHLNYLLNLNDRYKNDKSPCNYLYFLNLMARFENIPSDVFDRLINIMVDFGYENLGFELIETDIENFIDDDEVVSKLLFSVSDYFHNTDGFIPSIEFYIVHVNQDSFLHIYRVFSLC